MTDYFIESFKALCNYLNIEVNLPSMNIIKNLGDPEREALYLSGIRHKGVVLEKNWWKYNNGPMMGKLKDGTSIAILPHAISGYRIYDPKTNTTKKINAKIAANIDADAIVIYRTLPPESINFKSFSEFILGEKLNKEMIIILLCSLIAAVIQVIPALLSEEVFNTIIPENMRGKLFEIVVILIIFELANIGFLILINLGISRISIKAGLAAHTALCDRLIYLKMPFFNKYTAGELLQKIICIDKIKKILLDKNFKVIIFNLFIVVNIFVLFKFCAEITPIVLIMFGGLSAVYAYAGNKKYKINLKLIEAQNKAATFTHQSISGIHRIIASCAQDRIYNIWNSLETKKRLLKNRLNNIDSVLDSFLSVFKILSAAAVYLLIINVDNITMGSFIAFLSAFYIMQNSVFEMLGVLNTFPELMAEYKNIKPVLEAIPEYNILKSVPAEIPECIELNHVTFKYDDFGQTVINDISLKINKGESVGILGSSGSGKSTLLKLLMGFYSPTAGKIYYGGYDLETLNLRYLRKNMSVVMQNSSFIVGDIYDNIICKDKTLDEDKIIEILKNVGLLETILELPDGLRTKLERCKLSPGETQKLLIARAIAKKSKFIFLDEATSSLDNESQCQIFKSLKYIPAVKVIIAQRLETVKDCDRIFVMEQGRIIKRENYKPALKASSALITS